MKYLITILALLSLAASALAQTRVLATSTNGTVISGRTNAVTFTNPVAWNNSTNAATTISNLFSSNSLPSGAAAAGSVLTAAGDGSSSFVASRTVARILTNDYAKTNWGNNTFTVGTNAEAAFGTWSLDANSVYKIEWTVAYTYTTNAAGPIHGVVFSGNIYAQTNSALGWVSVPAGGGLQQITPSTLTWVDFNAGTNATGTRFRTGTIFVPTGTNAITAQFHWCPVSSNSNTLTLLRGSAVSFTKIAP